MLHILPCSLDTFKLCNPVLHVCIKTYCTGNVGFAHALNVLTSIKKFCSQSRPTLLIDLMCHLNKLNSNQRQSIWIPSHIGVTGNDRADALVKAVLSIDYVNSTDYLEF